MISTNIVGGEDGPHGVPHAQGLLVGSTGIHMPRPEGLEKISSFSNQ